MEQGGEEWFEARLGNVTASRIADLMAKVKSGESAGRRNYRAELVAERLTGQRAPGFKSAAMERGNEVEQAARDAYEFLNDATIVKVGYIPHPEVNRAGASPDGLVGDDGLVEIKCPNTATHIETLQGKSVPGQYRKQMQWQMACTGRKWCDYVSFDDRLPKGLDYFCARLFRDEVEIHEITMEVVSFLGELGALELQLRGMQK